jgi:hypothetical protein
MSKFGNFMGKGLFHLSTLDYSYNLNFAYMINNKIC